MSHEDRHDVPASRRQLATDTAGIAVSAFAFGLVYGLTARTAGLSPLEAGVMSVVVFAGGAQFAAVGALQTGASWTSILAVTAFINARHLLYGAALGPYFADRSRLLRAAMAHVLDDETFALSVAHFRRIGRADPGGYWFAALAGTFIPWPVATLIGITLGAAVPNPARLGLDIIYPAAMAGLTAGLIRHVEEVLAAMIAAISAIVLSLAWDPAAGIVLGAVLGSSVAFVGGSRGAAASVRE